MHKFVRRLDQKSDDAQDEKNLLTIQKGRYVNWVLMCFKRYEGAIVDHKHAMKSTRTTIAAPACAIAQNISQFKV